MTRAGRSDGPTAPMSRPARPELTGGRSVGVLLSHGFTGSPASIKPWGEALAAKGYAVEVPLLPGHGTTWQQMNATTFDDWYGTVSATFDRLVAEHDAVVVGGLSMGGMLVLRLAADHPDRVAGVVAVNPMVVTRRKDVLALPVLKRLVPSTPGIINDIKKGGDEHGYPRVPLRAAADMFRAGRELAADLARITAPLLLLKSTVDHVVDDSSLPLVTSTVSSRDVTVVPLENSYHVATLDNDAPLIEAESAAFVERVTAGWGRPGAG